MKRIEPIKNALRGKIAVPGDKSIAHRAVILSAVAHGRSRIFNLSGGDDNSRTVRAFRQMGVKIYRDGDSLCVEGKGWNGLHAPATPIDCGNSGTTMRLLSGLLAGRPFQSELDGDASLRQRPMQRVIDPLSQMGARIKSRGSNGLAPLEIDGGGLRGIYYRMPIASAQVKSAIVLAALQAQGQTTIEEPQRSRDHTEVMLAGFGGEISVEGSTIIVHSGSCLAGQDVHIPGDISSAAFFLVAAAMIPGSDLVVRDVGCNPTRDGVVEVLHRMGASIELANERFEAGERVADIHVVGGPLQGVGGATLQGIGSHQGDDRWVTRARGRGQGTARRHDHRGPQALSRRRGQELWGPSHRHVVCHRRIIERSRHRHRRRRMRRYFVPGVF
jgi:3-phosphoshikimate 1-carboxyvinyltransferase